MEAYQLSKVGLSMNPSHFSLTFVSNGNEVVTSGLLQDF
jgi:hypothetical protein